MELIGVDFIVDSADPGRVFCIDINLFPSYTGFPDVSRVFGNFIVRKCAECVVCFKYFPMRWAPLHCRPIVQKTQLESRGFLLLVNFIFLVLGSNGNYCCFEEL